MVSNSQKPKGKRPLLAESGPSILPIFEHLNVRFREKRTFRTRPEKLTILILNNLSRTTAIPPKADVRLI